MVMRKERRYGIIRGCTGVFQFRLFRHILMVVFIAILLAGCAKSTAAQLKEQLELGQNYLLEMNYEEAVVAFSKAIELDPKSWEAYEGLTNVYIAQEQYDKAYEVLSQAEENIPRQAGLEELRVEIAQRTSENSAEDVSADEAATALPESTENAEAEALLTEWLDNGDWDSIYEELSFEENQEYFLDLEEPMIVTGEDGNGIGIYVSGSSVELYIGGYENGVRSGFGVFGNIGADEYGPYKYVYEGEWENDYPNGEGTITNIYTDEFGEEQMITQGTFADGWENGEMTLILSGGGEPTSTYVYDAENGYPVVVGIDEISRDTGDPYFYIISEQSLEGDGPFTISDDQRFGFGPACKE